MEVAAYAPPPPYVTITHTGNAEIRAGSSSKTFVGNPFDPDGNPLSVTGTFVLSPIDAINMSLLTIVYGTNTISIQAPNNNALIDKRFMIKYSATDPTFGYAEVELPVTIISLF